MKSWWNHNRGYRLLAAVVNPRIYSWLWSKCTACSSSEAKTAAVLFVVLMQHSMVTVSLSIPPLLFHFLRCGQELCGHRYPIVCSLSGAAGVNPGRKKTTTLHMARLCHHWWTCARSLVPGLGEWGNVAPGPSGLSPVPHGVCSLRSVFLSEFSPHHQLAEDSLCSLLQIEIY